jgi:purine-nucleoside phosphorylase
VTGRSGEIAEAARWIRSLWSATPAAAVILGTGLGSLAREIVPDASIPFEAIPHFPRATAESHKGQLVCGRLAGIPVAAMEGRLHAYEGYSLAETTLPVRVLKELGIGLLIVSNASGGMNPRYRRGDVVVIEDHINLMGSNPLIERPGMMEKTNYPEMSRPYDPRLIERALEISRREGFVAHRGVYVAVKGPNYETRAEYRFMRRIGGDVVGMSTVPEVIVAAELGLKVLALSTVTNTCLPDALGPTESADVVAAARKAEVHMRRIVLGVLADLSAAD